MIRGLKTCGYLDCRSQLVARGPLSPLTPPPLQGTEREICATHKIRTYQSHCNHTRLTLELGQLSNDRTRGSTPTPKLGFAVCHWHYSTGDAPWNLRLDKPHDCASICTHRRFGPRNALHCRSPTLAGCAEVWVSSKRENFSQCQLCGETFVCSICSIASQTLALLHRTLFRFSASGGQGRRPKRDAHLQTSPSSAALSIHTAPACCAVPSSAAYTSGTVL